MFSLEAYPKFVYRPIGRFVVSGRGRRWLLSLGRLLVPSSRARLSSFRLAVRFARAHGTRFDCAPPLTIPNNAEVEAFASMILLPLSPSAVRSHGAIKREEPNQVAAHSVLHFRRGFKSPLCLYWVSQPLIRCKDRDNFSHVKLKITHNRWFW